MEVTESKCRTPERLGFTTLLPRLPRDRPLSALLHTPPSCPAVRSPGPMRASAHTQTQRSRDGFLC